MSATLSRPTQRRKFPHVRAAIYGQPWAISDKGLAAIVEIFEANVGGIQAEFVPVDMEESYGPGYDLTDNGVAILQLRGPIFPRANMMTRMSGATSLEEFSATFDKAMADEPNAVILDIDSPGGSVLGLEEFANSLFAAAQSADMPVIAFINGLGASAAYMIASQADMVYASVGSLVGSIGTIARLDNFSRADLNEGNDPVVIKSHELKGTGNGPFTDDQLADMERIVGEYFSKFKAVVSRARPEINMDTVATGQIWVAQSANGGTSAQDLGLIDGVTTLADLIAQYGQA